MPPSPLPCAPSGLSLRRCASLPQRLHLASRALHPRAHLTLPTHPLRPRVPDRPARALLVSGQARRSTARLHSQPHSPAQRRCASQWCGALRRRALPRCRPHYAATAPPRVAHRRPKSAAGGRCTAAPLHGRCTAAPARAAARRRQHMPHGRSCCAAAASGAQTDPAGAAGVSSRTHASPSALLSISSTCAPRAQPGAPGTHPPQPGKLPTRGAAQARRPPDARAGKPRGVGPPRWPPVCALNLSLPYWAGRAPAGRRSARQRTYRRPCATRGRCTRSWRRPAAARPPARTRQLARHSTFPPSLRPHSARSLMSSQAPSQDAQPLSEERHAQEAPTRHPRRHSRERGDPAPPQQGAAGSARRPASTSPAPPSAPLGHPGRGPAGRPAACGRRPAAARPASPACPAARCTRGGAPAAS